MLEGTLSNPDKKADPKPCTITWKIRKFKTTAKGTGVWTTDFTEDLEYSYQIQDIHHKGRLGQMPGDLINLSPINTPSTFGSMSSDFKNVFEITIETDTKNMPPLWMADDHNLSQVIYNPFFRNLKASPSIMKINAPKHFFSEAQWAELYTTLEANSKKFENHGYFIQFSALNGVVYPFNLSRFSKFKFEDVLELTLSGLHGPHIEILAYKLPSEARQQMLEAIIGGIKDGITHSVKYPEGFFDEQQIQQLNNALKEPWNIPNPITHNRLINTTTAVTTTTTTAPAEAEPAFLPSYVPAYENKKRTAGDDTKGSSKRQNTNNNDNSDNNNNNNNNLEWERGTGRRINNNNNNNNNPGNSSQSNCCVM